MTPNIDTCRTSAHAADLGPAVHTTPDPDLSGSPSGLALPSPPCPQLWVLLKGVLAAHH